MSSSVKSLNSFSKEMPFPTVNSLFSASRRNHLTVVGNFGCVFCALECVTLGVATLLLVDMAKTRVSARENSLL